MSTRSLLSLMVVTLFSAALVGCGGGSASSGGAGGGQGATSSLVVEVSSDNRVSSLHDGSGQNESLAAVISDLLISKALAQTAGVPIFVDGAQVAVTDASGSAVIPLEPGTYEVCILDPLVLTNCTTVVVEPDSVVVISNVNIDVDGLVTFDPPVTESSEDNIAAFEDPDNDKKTIICHKGKKTLSVGTPAAVNGHLGHGDTLGPCPEDSDQASEDMQSNDPDDLDDDDSGDEET